MSYNAVPSPSPYANTPYANSQYNDSTGGFIRPTAQVPSKKRTSNWIKYGVPVAIIVIAAAVVGAIFGARAKKSAAASSADSAVSSIVSVKGGLGRYPTATDTMYLVPEYPATVSSL